VLRRWWWILLLLALLGGYWLLPISGQVVVIPGSERGTLLWPQMRLSPASPRPGQEATLRVTDVVPWTDVLLAVDGQPAQSRQWPVEPGDALTWEWTFVVPDDGDCTLVFYHDCHTGCIERGWMVVGAERPPASFRLLPTKLGVVFANPDRDWHGRSGWDVELTYARLPDEEHWGIDDLAVHVQQATAKGLRVLVGPVRPWVSDQDGERRYTVDAPWLNYMNTLVAFLDETAQAKAAVGIPLATPDGFAIQSPGRPDAPELAGRDGAEEPRLDLRREEWNGAQAGFRIYRDWLDIVNAYPSTRGLPVYVTSSNTFTPDENVPPAQNYPRGWLTTALGVIDAEPQVQALCWFIDYFPHDTQWDYFSLTLHPGRLIDAAEER
jgi:hypothetical protein